MEEVQKFIIEIRAGIGGEEASLFAADLWRMYLRFFEKNKWRVKVSEDQQSDLKGVKNLEAEISGPAAFDLIKQEAGVHRVQRIPTTERSGRVHTSTASVAILPLADNSPIQIRDSDLDISFFRSSGHGGQNVNKVETAVRIVHRPSGIIVSSQIERFQQRNREIAMEMLKAKLWQLEREKTVGNLVDQRRNQIGDQERSEKIRTYNFPQNRITDHRINKSWHNLENIMAGGLEPIIKAFKDQK
ncbi:MAG: PCRF domain-containing protein [Patescibacteria group bacterium]|nr:PCRF domain-containing protein [Patescibacteria group bacterium]MCL5257787.1 PCRF domain-containing protein [Patescibacteria group bacterium]